MDLTAPVGRKAGSPAQLGRVFVVAMLRFDRRLVGLAGLSIPMLAAFGDRRVTRGR